MAFAGLKNDQERANVIAYLRTLSDNPLPLPAPPSDAARRAARRNAGRFRRSAAAEPAAAPAAEAPRRQPAPAATAEATARARTPHDGPAAPPTPQPRRAAPAEQRSRRPRLRTCRRLPHTAPAAPLRRRRTADRGRPKRRQQRRRQHPPPRHRAAAGGAGDADEGRDLRQALHRLPRPSTRAARTRSARISSGVVGRPVASVADYSYSDAMKAFSDDGIEGVGRGDARHLSGRPAQGRSGHQDGLPRHQGRGRPAERHRLSETLKRVAAGFRRGRGHAGAAERSERPATRAGREYLTFRHVGFRRVRPWPHSCYMTG